MADLAPHVLRESWAGVVTGRPTPRNRAPDPTCRTVALHRTLPDQRLQVFLQAHAVGRLEPRHRRRQIGESKRTLGGESDGIVDDLRTVTPAPPHHRRRLQIPLAVGTQAGARLIQRHFVAQACEHIVDDAARRRRVVHIVGDHGHHAAAIG